MSKAKKVRAVKSAIEFKEVMEKSEEILVTKEEPIKVEKKAIIKLIEASTLAKDGRIYVKDRSFIVVGDIQINYFKKDSRFNVTEIT